MCQLRPESRGHIRIKSGLAGDKPEIIANYLAAEIDKRVMLESVKIARRIVYRKPFADLIVREIAPGKEARTDEELLQYVKSKGTTIFHPVGTAKMGNDPMAVVDTRLRVRGIQGLRVVDGSIMPTLVSGNTNAPIIMIGEKASDMIKEDARNAPANAA
jgi:choline dehydrogenase